MVLANGYTVALSAATADTRAGLVRTGDPLAASANPDALAGGTAGGMAFQSTPQPSLPGPNKGLVIGLGVGGAAAAIATTVIVARRGGEVYMRAGWRFEMTLANPLSLDAAKVAEAVANPVPR
jgi:hypothetical protein